MKFTTEKINPKRAAEILEGNEVNRVIKQAVVLDYAKQMREGKWYANTGEAIKITSSKRLIDGQHRMLAVIESGKTISFMFVNEMSGDAYKYIDQGRVRSGYDTLHVHGVQKPRMMAAIIRAHYGLLNGSKTGRTASLVLSNLELTQEYDSRPELWREVISLTESYYKQFNRVLPASLLGGLLVFFRSIDEENANSFMSKLCAGVGLKEKDPLTFLRNRLVNEKLSTTNLPLRIKLALIYKAWNLHKNNKTTERLSFSSNEEYPDPYK